MAVRMSSVRRLLAHEGAGFLLQGNENVLGLFSHIELALTEQPAKTHEQVLVGADFGGLFQILARKVATLVEGFPNFAGQLASFFFKHDCKKLVSDCARYAFVVLLHGAKLQTAWISGKNPY